MEIKTHILPVILVATLPLLLLTSCHRGAGFDLENNTGQDLALIGLNSVGQPTKYEVKKNRVLQMGMFSKLEIRHQNGQWIYTNAADIPRKYWKRGRMVSVISLQIEPDGAIYVLLPGTRGPVSNFPAQPQGYPLKPDLRG